MEESFRHGTESSMQIGRNVSPAQFDELNRSLFSAARDGSLMSLAEDTVHDARGVLNVIAMNVELLARAAEPEGATWPQGMTATRSAEVVRRELRKLEQLLNVLLCVRMIERDAPESFDLVEVCRMLVKLVTPRASRQHVAIRCAAPAGIRVLGFPDLIHGAILSLMINALDAMTAGGTLSVTVSQTEKVRIKVCDTGPGCPAEVLRHVRKPGFTTKARGKGLGLHTAQTIVESHGGTLHYEPVRSGCCLVIELPRIG